MATLAEIQTLIDGRTDGGDNPISTERALWEIIKSQFFIGQVIWVKMAVGDIPTYFVTAGPTTGLGKSDNIYNGYAMPNGNNGLPNDENRVSIAPSANYTSGAYPLGATGGEKDHVLTIPELPENNKSVHHFVAGVTSGGGSGPQPWSAEVINFGGADEAHNNMQPYVVELKLVRIA